VKLTGAVDAAAAAADDSSAQQESGPQIEQIMPRIYSRAGLILGLALGILALGLALLLYRAQGNQDERGCRRGRLEVLRRLSGPAQYPLRVEPGSCLALIGRNGAGKTTLLRIVAGFSRPGKGEVKIFGLPPRETEARRQSASSATAFRSTTS
jgi:hypothetical protein